MKYKILEETHQWTSDDKIEMIGYGEWVEEVDYIEIEYQEYRAKIQRQIIKECYAIKEAYFGGHLCGYVKIPENHYLYDKEIKDIECHGGLSFISEENEEKWIGFDCAHSGDIVPSQILTHKEIPLVLIRLKDCFKPTYKNMQFCIDECISIIDQLINLDDEEFFKELEEWEKN